MRNKALKKVIYGGAPRVVSEFPNRAPARPRKSQGGGFTFARNRAPMSFAIGLPHFLEAARVVLAPAQFLAQGGNHD